MEYSPKTYDEWREKGRLKNAIERLKVTQNASAMLVCHHVVCGNMNIGEYRRYARIALAAQTAHTRMLLKYVEGR